MSFRSKTLKAEKYGTPITPTITTPKAPSPKEPQIIKTIPQVVVTATKVSSKTHPRTAISFGVTPTQEGIKAQQSFTQKLYSVTIPIKNEIDRLKDSLFYYTSGGYLTDPERTGQTGQHNDLMISNLTDQIHTKEKDIDTIVEDIINIELQANVNQIIQAIESGQILTPDYFHNNIAWVKAGSISQQEFLDTYYTLSHQGIIHTALAEPELIIEEPMIEEPMVLLSANIKISFTNPNIGGFSSSIPINDIGELQILSNSTPEWKYTLIDSSTNQPISTLNELINNINDLLASVEPDEPEPVEPDITITDNMVTQQLINFNIVNGRAVGSIKFVATNNFNPYYYNKNIVNIIQFKDPNGAKFGVVKENRLNFTETERDEVISYDEDMQGNTRATVESFVWSSATAPTAFSKMFGIEISEAEPPKPITSGFMGAGIAGAIAGLVLIGFIADHKRGK